MTLTAETIQLVQAAVSCAAIVFLCMVVLSGISDLIAGLFGG
jgi:hypothetical protein